MNQLTTCLHCNKPAARHGRGLCQRCYKKRAIRALFPAGNSRLGLWAGPLPAAREAAFRPTAHLPGTEGKVAVMAARAAAGLPLFHPDDARPPESVAAGRS
jgi:hypothetical protein